MANNLKLLARQQIMSKIRDYQISKCGKFIYFKIFEILNI